MSQLEFDDIALVPRVVSTIESRDHINIGVKSLNLKIPIIASPMKDVCDGRICHLLKRLGGLGIVHRFMSIEEQVEQWKISGNSACAIGVNGDFHERFEAIYGAGCRIICIDTANGGSTRVKKAIEKLNKPGIGIIAGNVASKECYQWLDEIPFVIGIRVGIAGGAACTTKNATGIHYGVISSILECAKVKKNALLIADGGIREPSDSCKAIACGADLVMLGSTIASVMESPAELVKRDDKLFKVYHGSASFEIQKEYRTTPRYIEGRVRLLEYSGETLESLITRFCDGLRSSMSYFNAKSIEEYQQNASFATL